MCVFVYVFVYVCICVWVCMCVCVSVCVEGGCVWGEVGRVDNKSTQTTCIGGLLVNYPSICPVREM